MSKQRIVFLPYKLHLRHLLFALAERASVTALIPPGKSVPEDSKVRGVPIRYWKFGAGLVAPLISSDTRTLKYVVGLSKLLDDLHIRALVTFEFYHWYTLQCISYKKRRPELKLFVVWETKRWPRNFFARSIKRMLLLYFRMEIKHVDGILVYTESAQEFLIAHVPEAKVSLLPAPTDTRLFTPRSGHSFDGNTLRLLMNARYAPYKRHVDLLEALARLHKKGRAVRLTCIGRPETGKERVIALAAQMGVAELVEFREPLMPEAIPGLYHQHDVLVLPSYNEAIGMVVPEAMACGLPTVTSDTVGANVYVNEGETGFIYPTGDVNALTECLEQCFDQSKLERMGRSAVVRIRTHFTPEAVASLFLDIVSGDAIVKEER